MVREYRDTVDVGERRRGIPEDVERREMSQESLEEKKSSAPPPRKKSKKCKSVPYPVPSEVAMESEECKGPEIPSAGEFNTIDDLLKSLSA